MVEHIFIGARRTTEEERRQLNDWWSGARKNADLRRDFQPRGELFRHKKKHSGRRLFGDICIYYRTSEGAAQPRGLTGRIFTTTGTGRRRLETNDWFSAPSPYCRQPRKPSMRSRSREDRNVNHPQLDSGLPVAERTEKSSKEASVRPTRATSWVAVRLH